MYYVADTHSFLWYLIDSPKLSIRARSIFELSERNGTIIIIPAIVLIESIDILDKKKIDLRFEQILLKISQSSNFILSNIDLSLILEINKTKGLNDLHDRTIVATAKIFDAHIISKDREIKKFYKKTVW